MTLTQIRYFICVAERLSFSQAAEKLYVSQSAISRQIRLLEDELNVELFERLHHSIRLTEVGDIYYGCFKRFEIDFQAVNASVAKLKGNISGTLVVSLLSGWDLSILEPGFVDLFSRKYPNIRLSFSAYHLGEMCSRLERNETDILITIAEGLPDHDSLQTTILDSLRMGILFSADSKYTKIPLLRPFDFANETFLYTPDRNLEGYFNRFPDIRKILGFTPKTATSPNYPSLLLDVHRGSGVIFCDEWCLDSQNPLFQFLPTELCAHICVSYASGNGSAIKEVFASELVAWYKVNALRKNIKQPTS